MLIFEKRCCYKLESYLVSALEIAVCFPAACVGKYNILQDQLCNEKADHGI